MKNSSDTIAAQATPPGKGGVGVVRVSGPEVLSIAKSILGKTISPREATFCGFYDGDQTTIDQGVAIYFSAPNSFTGEDVLELQGHGGQVVMDLLLKRVLSLGVRLAGPGEFTERAFLNHKLDLSQVEAVADLINAATSEGAKNAVRSLQGEFSKRIHRLVEKLTKLRANIESTIDFVDEEDAPEADIENFKLEQNNLLSGLRELISVAKQGVLLQEGVTIVITGEPNVGKSSLLNYFSGEDTAIVTDIPGTTRDTLHIHTQIDGVPINLIDTAGFRDGPDIIEAEGIRRAKEEIKKSHHILLMVDASVNQDKISKNINPEILEILPSDSGVTVLYNKIDLVNKGAKITQENNVTNIHLSLKTGCGLDLLKQHLKNSIGFNVIEDGFSARRRHLDALIRAEKRMSHIDEGLFAGWSVEIIAEELRGAQQILGEITGEVVADDLLEKIFSEFCIGK